MHDQQALPGNFPGQCKQVAEQRGISDIKGIGQNQTEFILHQPVGNS